MGDNEETFKLTEWGILYVVLTEYGIDVSHISGSRTAHRRGFYGRNGKPRLYP